MSDAAAVNVALLVLRCGVGAVMAAHGVNHILGGGRIEGTARWFASMGMRRPRLQAWLASVTEIAAGASLIAGFLMPLGAAGVVGTMAVAWIINHRRNGFFIFRPGEGWEYVMTLLLCGLALATLGGGEWSFDHVLGIGTAMSGGTGLLISALAGGLGSLLLLAVSWRPNRRAVPAGAGS